MVVNPAAYTAVDKAETEPDQAFAVNRDGARAVAAAAADRGVPIIHLSTDYVFDGKKKEPYSETDSVRPQGVYGRSKLEGEWAVAEANPSHILLRTTWVYPRSVATLCAPCFGWRERARTATGGRRSVWMSDYAPNIAEAIIAIAEKWRVRTGTRNTRASPISPALMLGLGTVSRGRSFRGPRSVADALFRLTRSPLPTIPRRRQDRLIPAYRAKGWKPFLAFASTLKNVIGRLFGPSASSLDWGMF